MDVIATMLPLVTRMAWADGCTAPARDEARTWAIGRRLLRIGKLTGRRDCPGLNAVIRAAVTKGVQVRTRVRGLPRRREGPLEGLTRPLGSADVEGILAQGFTILGSSRTNPYKVDGGLDRIRTNIQDVGVGVLIAIGGEDSHGVAKKLTDDGLGVVGVPKTIDNDLSATDYTFGFDTAVTADAVASPSCPPVYGREVNVFTCA